MSFNTAFLLEYLSHHRCGVAAIVAEDGAPHAALIRFVVNDRLELVFDGQGSPDLAISLSRQPRIALMVGGCTPSDDSFLQYEGVVERPAAEEIEKVEQAYFAAFPDSTRGKRGLATPYLRIRPRWIRYCDRNVAPPKFVIFDGNAPRRHNMA